MDTLLLVFFRGDMKTFLILVTLFFSLTSNAVVLSRHEPGPELLKKISEHNKQQAIIELRSPRSKSASESVVPFYEYGETGYIVMNDDDYYGYAEEIKKEIAKNLPKDVKLIIYTDSSDKSYHKQLANTYGKYMSSDQLKILYIPGGYNSFWSRDNLPIPVYSNNKLQLVDAKYYYNFEPDSVFAELFNAKLTSHNFFYEGGNFMANAKGDCIVVNRKKSYPGGVSDTAAIPDSIFKNDYGCKTLTRLKHIKGIGHADEVVKFMSDDTILTDTKEYQEILETKGFNVILLPEADIDYETYINSLQVNGTIFVPVFGEVNDNKVIKTYENLGLKVVPINTRDLATGGQGGIHCITMNYPPVPLNELIQSLKAQIVF